MAYPQLEVEGSRNVLSLRLNSRPHSRIPLRKLWECQILFPSSARQEHGVPVKRFRCTVDATTNGRFQITIVTGENNHRKTPLRINPSGIKVLCFHITTGRLESRRIQMAQLLFRMFWVCRPVYQENLMQRYCTALQIVALQNRIQP